MPNDTCERQSVTKKAAIVQSNYIPWKGYFDMIAAVDEFILFDDVQFTKNDWRNRNQIKTPAGVQWLTVPVGQDIKRRIRDVELPDNGWQATHWKTLCLNYSRAPHFERVAAFFEPSYVQQRFATLSALNRHFIEAVCRFLGITTTIRSSSEFLLVEGKCERLADLCAQIGADHYVSGPAAKDYIDEHVFAERGIKLDWFDYSGYPEYPQLWGGFNHHVSVLDLLFNCGSESRRSMKIGSEA